MTGTALGIGGGIAAGIATAPISIPLAIAFGVAAAFTGSSLPFRAQATYIIGKDEHQKKKAAKAEKKKAQAPTAN